MRFQLCLAFVLLVRVPLGAAGPPNSLAPDRVLFDFEGADCLKGWSNLQLPGAKAPGPAVEVGRAVEYATSGEHSLRLTFAGGDWPTVTTTSVPDDWTAFETLKADVTVSRPCLMGFCVMQEGSKRGGHWDGAVSRWVKTELIRPGRTTMSAPLHPNGWSAIRTKLEDGRVLGKVVRLEIFAYRPAPGETIFVDHIRLSAAKEPAKPALTEFAVLGTDLRVSGVQELAKELKDQWKQPEPGTVEAIEAGFRGRLAELRKTHPGAVLAIFRDGDAGFDPAHPGRVYYGWKDAYWSSHGPDGMTEERAANFGRDDGKEIFMRHRSPLMRVELASIPTGSEVLGARLVIVNGSDALNKDHHANKPNMWVAEACNRQWDEYEVNAYEYARGKFWKAVGGMDWAGDDPDFHPLYLAHGPSQGKVNSWDFTHAVRFWTDGKHVNHGFMLHGDGQDWIGRACSRESAVVKDRPALLVIYVPR
jgi:hypothetical protein